MLCLNLFLLALHLHRAGRARSSRSSRAAAPGEGATLADLIEATGWLPHTTRAALTGLRKKGHVLAKDKRGDATCYRIAGAAE